MKVALKVMLGSAFLLSSVAQAEMLACDMVFENQTEYVVDQIGEVDLGAITATPSTQTIQARNFTLEVTTLQDGGYGKIALFLLDKTGSMIINTQLLSIPGVGFDYWDAQIPYTQAVTGLNPAGQEQQLTPELALFICQAWLP